MKAHSPIFAMLMLATSMGAQNINGTIQISRTLTRHSVTSTVPMYQRGPTVKLGKDAETDPLAFERSHVIIYLEGAIAGTAEAQPATLRMEQRDRQFVPDLLVVPMGATVSFPNQDPIFHNVFSLSRAKSFDLGSYDKGDARRVVFNKAGIVDVYCHLHPNMAATIFVPPNRYYARADRDGHFQIHDVPPGSYTVVAWHRSAGTFRQKVQIEAGHDVSINFVLPYTDAMPAMAPMKDSK